MTENEAISRIKDHMEIHRLKEPRAIYITIALSMAISALKEVQQYRKIGTMEECREAVAKQKAQKPKELDTEYGYFICGNCGGAIACTDDFKSHKYCLNCGQAINWEESEEEYGRGNVC